LSRLLTSLMTAHTVDHEEESAYVIRVNAILIVLPNRPLIADSRRKKAWNGRRHSHSFLPRKHAHASGESQQEH